MFSADVFLAKDDVPLKNGSAPGVALKDKPAGPTQFSQIFTLVVAFLTKWRFNYVIIVAGWNTLATTIHLRNKISRYVRFTFLDGVSIRQVCAVRQIFR